MFLAALLHRSAFSHKDYLQPRRRGGGAGGGGGGAGGGKGGAGGGAGGGDDPSRSVELKDAQGASPWEKRSLLSSLGHSMRLDDLAADSKAGFDDLAGRRKLGLDHLLLAEHLDRGKHAPTEAHVRAMADAVWKS